MLEPRSATRAYGGGVKPATARDRQKMYALFQRVEREDDPDAVYCAFCGGEVCLYNCTPDECASTGWRRQLADGRWACTPSCWFEAASLEEREHDEEAAPP